jgi:hypothetical protein
MSGVVKGNLDISGAIERVVTWPKPLNKVTASIKQNIEVSG